MPLVVRVAMFGKEIQLQVQYVYQLATYLVQSLLATCSRITLWVCNYSTYYYKPMGDLPYISSEQGGLIIRTKLITIIIIISRILCVRLSVTDVTSLPQRVRWERDSELLPWSTLVSFKVASIWVLPTKR